VRKCERRAEERKVEGGQRREIFSEGNGSKDKSLPQQPLMKILCWAPVFHICHHLFLKDVSDLLWKDSIEWYICGLYFYLFNSYTYYNVPISRDASLLMVC